MNFIRVPIAAMSVLAISLTAGCVSESRAEARALCGSQTYLGQRETAFSEDRFADERSGSASRNEPDLIENAQIGDATFRQNEQTAAYLQDCRKQARDAARDQKRRLNDALNEAVNER